MSETHITPPTDGAATAPKGITITTPELDKALLGGGLAAVLLGIILPQGTVLGVGVGLTGMGIWYLLNAMLLLGGLAAIVLGAVKWEGTKRLFATVKEAWITLGVGLASVATGLWQVVHIHDAASDLGAFSDAMTVGAGAWLLIIGGIALAVLGYRKDKGHA